VIAAGGEADAPLAAAIGERHKALARYRDRPIVENVVLAALDAGLEVALVCAPEVLSALGPLSHRVLHSLPGASGIRSAVAGASLMKAGTRLIFLPGDCPLIQPKHLTEFAFAIEARLGSGEADTWFAAGITPRERVQNALPGAPYKYLRLRDGHFASGALFATNHRGLRSAHGIFEAVHRNRKSQLRMLLGLGPGPLFAYATGRLSIDGAERSAGRLLGGPSYIIPDSHPATTFDIDTPEDWRWLLENEARLRLE
jgi:CTP:molybdopterin cytidylyltransferase MocA